MTFGELWPTFLSTLFGALLGGAITRQVSRMYYESAAQDLARETSDLRRRTRMILRGLENAGIVEVVRDDGGDETGLVIGVGANLLAGASMSAEQGVALGGGQQSRDGNTSDPQS